MEIEYKWNLPDEKTATDIRNDKAVARYVEAVAELAMHATYYDTAAGDVRRMHGGLRLRSENDTSVCCLKLSADAQDACKTRREYEVGARDIYEGLRLLLDAGAPQDVCSLLAAGNPTAICETEFDREARQIKTPDFSAELAFDYGQLLRNGESAPIHEVELEYKTGSETAFHDFAARLQQVHSLQVQPLSKLARAMAL